MAALAKGMDVKTSAGRSSMLRGGTVRLEGPYCCLRFFVHQTNVKILLIGQRPVIQEHEGLLTFTFNMAGKSRDRFEFFLEETLLSLPERKWHQIRAKSRAKESD